MSGLSVVWNNVKNHLRQPRGRSARPAAAFPAAYWRHCGRISDIFPTSWTDLKYLPTAGARPEVGRTQNREGARALEFRTNPAEIVRDVEGSVASRLLIARTRVSFVCRTTWRHIFPDLNTTLLSAFAWRREKRGTDAVIRPRVNRSPECAVTPLTSQAEGTSRRQTVFEPIEAADLNCLCPVPVHIAELSDTSPPPKGGNRGGPAAPAAAIGGLTALLASALARRVHFSSPFAPGVGHADALKLHAARYLPSVHLRSSGGTTSGVGGAAAVAAAESERFLTDSAFLRFRHGALRDLAEAVRRMWEDCRELMARAAEEASGSLPGGYESGAKGGAADGDGGVRKAEWDRAEAQARAQRQACKAALTACKFSSLHLCQIANAAAAADPSAPAGRSLLSSSGETLRLLAALLRPGRLLM